MMRKRSARWPQTPWRLAALALGCAACNGGNGGKDIPLADFEAESRAALCHYLVVCERVPDQATCIASTNIEESVSFFPTMQVDVAAGLVAYDAKAARACVDGFNSIRSCTQLELAPLFQGLQGTCDAVFSGTLAPGSACFFDEECTGRDVCSRSACATPECCSGTCFATPPPIPAGGDCSNMPQGWSCAAGTSCRTDPQTQARLCTPFLAAGADCRDVAGECPSPYLCQLVPPGDQAVCTPPVGQGQACGDAGDTNRCNDLRGNCDANTRTCTASIPVGGACVNGGCVRYAQCVGAICVARGGPGDACENDYGCLQDLACDATLHCSLPPPGPSCR